MLMRIPALSGVMRSSGAEYLGISRSGEIAIMKAGDWEESKHPRAENGQFGSGSGKGKESAGAKHKRNQQARRAESVGQSTLGGKAIQSLLSGGSALDKIGWLNTSKPKEQEKPKEPEKKPEAEKPKEPEPAKAEPGNGSPASFKDMFGESKDHVKVEGSIDYNKPYVLRISGKTYDHSKNLKSLGFKWGSTSKTWYKGIEPKEGKDAKAELLEHIKGVSSGSGAPTQLKATMTQGKLVPKGQGTPAAAPGVKTPAKPATAPKPFPSNPNDGKPGTVPAHELGSLLSDIVEMEDEIVRHEARRDWEPEVKLSAPIPELKRKIEEARAKYKESADRLTPAARYEVLSEHNYNKIKRGRRSGPSKELRELGEKGGLYKK
jgi:hypothetical protein